MFESGLITPSGETINIPYYEIGNYAKNICQNYIKESTEHKVEFEKFAQNYHFFEPYFDFIMFHLKYKMINPFLNEDSIGYVIGKYFVTKTTSLNSKNKIEKYTSTSDKDLQITNYKDTSLKEGFINSNGIGFKVNRIIDMGHPKLCEILLNQYMIHNKEIYDDYVNYIMKSNINATPSRIEFYMIQTFSFVQMCIYDTEFGIIMYDDSKVIDWFEEFQNIFQSQYENIMFLPISEELNLEIDSINKEGDIHESRRI